MTDEPINETTATDATTATAATEPVAQESTASTTTAVAIVKPSKDQLRHLTDAVASDLVRLLNKGKVSLKPKQIELVQRVADRAVVYRIEAAITPADDKSAKKLRTKREAVEAQLANLKTAAAVISNKKLWATVDAVVTRMTQFAIGAVVAAL